MEPVPQEKLGLVLINISTDAEEAVEAALNIGYLLCARESEGTGRGTAGCCSMTGHRVSEKLGGCSQRTGERAVLHPPLSHHSSQTQP